MQNQQYMGRAMRKRAFGHLRTTKTQISLRIRAVWSGSALSAISIIGYYGLYKWRATAQMIICTCAWWAESAYSRRMFEDTFSLDVAIIPEAPNI